MDLPIFSRIDTITLPQIPHQKIWVKRDDLIDTFISGNKWRKLKYTLKEAQLQQKNHLVSFGGAFSNHLLALAAAGAKFNFQTTAFVRGENVDNPMLQFCKLFGMQLIFVDRTLYKNKTGLFEKYFGHDQSCFFIDEGGESEAAIQGCIEIIEELNEHFDHIFCASGTGTTVLGLLNGLKNKNLNSRLHVIPVLKNSEEIATKLQTVQHEFELHNAYHFGGYAKSNTTLLQFTKDFIAHTGIMIEPIYTGKVFYAVQDLFFQKKLSSSSKVLVIHTGGIFGILGKMPLI